MACAQGDQLSNHGNPNTLQWGTLRENLDKLERDIHGKGIPLMKTWRYIHSQFPATNLHKDTRMGLLEVSTGFRFNMDFKMDQRDIVKDMMTHITLSGKVAVNMNHRHSWGSFSQDKMVSWDITVNGKDLREACEEAELLWVNFSELNPLIGYVNMFNIDQVQSIILEVTHSEALRMLQFQGDLTWVLMVAPKLASISMKDSLTMDLQGLDDLVQIIQDHNKKFKGTKVKDGGFFVDRVVLGKPWLDIPEVNSRTQASRVFWDRFWKHDTREFGETGGTGTMANRDIKNDLEVLVTMAGFQHQAKNKEFYLAFLQTTIGPYIMAKAPMEVTLMCKEPALTWTTTGAPTVFKVTCSHQTMAKWLCVELVDMELKQEGNLGTISFKSTMHSQKKTDWSKLFQNLMITDVSSEFRTSEHSPTSTTSWQLTRDPEAPMPAIPEEGV
jgi:hypothetical protein